MWFYTGDHGPPHFHAAVVDAWEIRVYFLQEPPTYDEVFKLRRIPARTVRQILGRAAEHRTELFGEWERSRADE